MREKAGGTAPGIERVGQRFRGATLDLTLASARVVTSYAAMINIIGHLKPVETTKLQLLCTFMYNIGVGRVQTRIKLPDFTFCLQITASNLYGSFTGNDED